MLAGRGWGKCSEEELWRGERWGSGAPVGGKEEEKLRERRTGVTEADCDSGRGSCRKDFVNRCFAVLSFSTLVMKED